MVFLRKSREIQDFPNVLFQRFPLHIKAFFLKKTTSKWRLASDKEIYPIPNFEKQKKLWKETKPLCDHLINSWIVDVRVLFFGFLNSDRNNRKPTVKQKTI